MTSLTGTADEVSQLFSRLEALTVKDKRVQSELTKVKGLILTLKRLPLERQRQEFNCTIFQALNGVSFYRDYDAKEAWREELFPRFIEQWGNIPIAEFPLNRWKHQGVISWLRGELDKLRLAEAKNTVAKLTFAPRFEGATHEVEVHLSDTVGEVAARVAELAGVPRVTLYLDSSFLVALQKPLIEAGVRCSQAPLQWMAA